MVMGPNLDAAARQGKAGGHNRVMGVACAAVFASVLAFGAGAQEFVIPGAAELAAMSVQAKIEMERQLTAVSPIPNGKRSSRPPGAATSPPPSSSATGF